MGLISVRSEVQLLDGPLKTTQSPSGRSLWGFVVFRRGDVSALTHLAPKPQRPSVGHYVSSLFV